MSILVEAEVDLSKLEGSWGVGCSQLSGSGLYQSITLKASVLGLTARSDFSEVLPLPQIALLPQLTLSELQHTRFME